MLQHSMYLDSRNQTMSKQDFSKCKVLAHIKLISKGRSTCTCCNYITDRLYHKITYFHMIIVKKYLLFSLKLPFSKKIYIKDLSTIYYKRTKIELYGIFTLYRICSLKQFIKTFNSNFILI